MRGLQIVGVFLLFVSQRAEAAPPNLEQVPATAQWVMLIDVDGAMQATGWRQSYDCFWQQHGFAFAVLENILGLDLKAGLHNVTFFASGIGACEHATDFRGGAIVSLDYDRQTLNDRLSAIAGDRVVMHGEHSIYHWPTAGQGQQKQMLCVALCPANTIVFSTSIEDTQHAIDVLNGTAANVTQAASPLATALPVGSLFVARGSHLHEVVGDFGSPILEQCESLSLTVGEHQQQAFVHGHARFKSPDHAQQIETVVNGSRALMQLHGGPQGDLGRMLGGLRCVRTDDKVSLALRIPASDVPALLESLDPTTPPRPLPPAPPSLPRKDNN